MLLKRRAISRAGPVLAAASLGVALTLFLAGGRMAVQSYRGRLVREGTLGGVHLALHSARWLEDQMDHGVEGFAMPPSMMPDMPPREVQRLSAAFSFCNLTRRPQRIRTDEFSLQCDDDGSWKPVTSDVPELALGPGEAINAVLQFDYRDKLEAAARARKRKSQSGPEVRLLWRREGTTVAMPLTYPPFCDEPKDAVKWPELATELPEGFAETGESLFAFYCASCHGHPEVPGSETVGPSLASAGNAAALRVEGKTAGQYLYESILNPNAYVVRDCPRGPCAEPSSMPGNYSEALTLQKMADLIAYLLQQKHQERRMP